MKKQKIIIIIIIIAIIAPLAVIGQTGIELAINEFVPNPTGPDAEEEWIEIKNLSDFQVNLAGWRICDFAKKCYWFKNNESILANGYLLLPRGKTKIAINNDQETLSLIAPGEQIAFRITIEGSREGSSFSRFGPNDWRWTEILTPGEENKINEPELKIDDSDQAINNYNNEKTNRPSLTNDSFDSENLAGNVKKVAGIAITLGLIFGISAGFLVNRFLIKD